MVSYDRSETAVGESIHISALERLGEEVPYDSQTKIYEPGNVLAALADLRSRYGDSDGLTWEPDTLSVTLWSGEIVNEQSALAVRQGVKRTIEEAIGRLLGRGVNLHRFGIGDP